MIKRVKGGYKATTESGRPLSKKPKSQKSALAQLYAVEMSKARRHGGGRTKRSLRAVGRRVYGS